MVFLLLVFILMAIGGVGALFSGGSTYTKYKCTDCGRIFDDSSAHHEYNNGDDDDDDYSSHNSDIVCPRCHSDDYEYI